MSYSRAWWLGLATATPPPGTRKPWTSDMMQNALINIPDFSQVIEGSFTLEFHFRLAANFNAVYTAEGRNVFQLLGNYYGYFVWDSGEIPAGRVATNELPGTFGNGGTNHIALVSDADTLTRYIYIDGQLIYTQGVSSSESARFISNGYGGSNNFAFTNYAGPMGEVRYWAKVRSQAEIQDTMNSTLSGYYPTLLGCWRCDERGPIGTQVRDRSGNNYHGFIS